VALTGCWQDAERIKALAAGFDQHVLKPVDQAFLRSPAGIGRTERFSRACVLWGLCLAHLEREAHESDDEGKNQGAQDDADRPEC
jgi:hypothetical protein